MLKPQQVKILIMKYKRRNQLMRDKKRKVNKVKLLTLRKTQVRKTKERVTMLLWNKRKVMLKNKKLKVKKLKRMTQGR